MSDSESAFNQESFQPVVIIQLMRLYDLMMALLVETNPVTAAKIKAMHEAGLSWCPPPAFAMEEENE